jgi:hypothetical protein
MFKNKYRVVTDQHLGFECQKRLWYWPFWFQMNYSNTHPTVERAKEYIKNDKVVVVST